jgi:ankyrin repeat protein
LKNGAYVNAQGECHDIALQATVYTRSEEVVSLFFLQIANINAKGGDFDNAPQVAVHAGLEEVVSLLFKCGANVNAGGGRKYDSALEAAEKEGHKHIVEILLEHDAETLWW